MFESVSAWGEVQIGKDMGINMEINIIPVSEANRKEIVSLHVAKNQVGFIETVEECLLEAEELSLWRPVGIYTGGEAIGFAMYGLYLYEGEQGRVWLDRFLIDRRFQGKGFGRHALQLLLDRLFLEYGHTEIFLSLYENNIGALALYQQFGFHFNGELDINGEKVMVYNFAEDVPLFLAK